ncbi:hypothetical protein N9L18_00390 [Candidatus Pacebacteria bacterium]|nr:hypothetical protein [Candidatus Paceibacterota bacterium]
MDMKNKDNHEYGALFIIIAVLVIGLLIFVVYLFLGKPTSENFSLIRNQVANIVDHDFYARLKEKRSNQSQKVSINVDPEKNKQEDFNIMSGEGYGISFSVSKSDSSGMCEIIWQRSGFKECSLINSMTEEIVLIKQKKITEGVYNFSCLTNSGKSIDSKDVVCK